MTVNKNDRKRVRLQPVESSSHCRLYKTNSSMKQERSHGPHEYDAVVDELSGHLTDQVEEFKDSLAEIMEDEEVIEDLAQIFTINQTDTFTGTMEILQRHDMVHTDLIECIEHNLFGELDD